MEQIPLPPGSSPDRGHHRSHHRSRGPHWTSRSPDRGPPNHVLPIALAVLCAMIAIPAISLNTFDAFDSRSGSYARGGDYETMAFANDSQIRLSELPVLPHRPEQSHLQELKTWVRAHFSEEEIADMKERFIGGRSEAEVTEHIDRLASEVSRGDFRNVPRELADLVKGRLGNFNTQRLKNNVVEVEVQPGELRLIPLREIYPLEPKRMPE